MGNPRILALLCGVVFTLAQAAPAYASESSENGDGVVVQASIDRAGETNNISTRSLHSFSLDLLSEQRTPSWYFDGNNITVEVRCVAQIDGSFTVTLYRDGSGGVTEKVGTANLSYRGFSMASWTNVGRGHITLCFKNGLTEFLYPALMQLRTVGLDNRLETIMQFQHSRSGFYFSCILGIVVLMGLLISPMTAFAYSFNGHKMRTQIWYRPSVIFQQETRDHLREAMRTWNEILPGERNLCFDPTTHPYVQVPFNDGRSLIFKKPNSDPSNLATNYYFKDFFDSSWIIESDINFNANKSWSNGKLPGCFNVETVMLHELGHTVGLGHSQYSYAVMYPTIAANFTRTELSSDEINGHNALY